MIKAKGRMDERILVCVYYGPNGERLIRRGCKIATMLNCPLYILTVDPKPFEEFDVEKVDYVRKWKKIAEEEPCIEKFILKDNEKRPVTKVIAEVARELHITQIILGQTAKSLWEQITRGSIINALLHEIPFIDLHIVSVARALKHEEGFFEKGIRAYLVKEGDRYRLTFQYSKDVLYEGIFFKELGTDFNNGVFKFIDNKEIRQIPIVDDYVVNWEDVNVTEL